MFTGIVEEVGEVVDLTGDDDVVVLTVRGDRAVDVGHGDSVAVNGCCLTAVRPDGADGLLRVELVQETLRRTALGALRPGAKVNLERALPASGRLDGHIVQGHVDGVGTLVGRTPGERSDEVRFSLPADLARYVVEKGSIAVSGVSLTVAAVGTDETGADEFSVALIPTTLADTTLGALGPGDPVNLEVDVIAKYVERMTVAYRSGQESEGR